MQAPQTRNMAKRKVIEDSDDESDVPPRKQAKLPVGQRTNGKQLGSKGKDHAAPAAGKSNAAAKPGHTAHAGRTHAAAAVHAQRPAARLARHPDSAHAESTDSSSSDGAEEDGSGASSMQRADKNVWWFRCRRLIDNCLAADAHQVVVRRQGTAARHYHTVYVMLLFATCNVHTMHSMHRDDR